MKKSKREEVRNILFVCRYNRFRSRVAADYFKKLNGGKFRVKSAGIVRGTPVDKIEKKAASDFGLDISGKPRGLSSELLLWSDKIFVVADDVPRGVFEDNKGSLKKTTILKVKDVNVINHKSARSVVENVVAEVDKINKKLNNKNKETK